MFQDESAARLQESVANMMKQFAALDSFEADLPNFNLMYDYVKKTLEEIPLPDDVKSDELAAEIAEKGRSYYKSNRLEEAWELFTKSIATCATPGRVMATGYSERSFCSLFWNRKQDYIADNAKAASLKVSDLLTGLYEEKVNTMKNETFAELSEEALEYVTNESDDEPMEVDAEPEIVPGIESLKTAANQEMAGNAELRAANERAQQLKRFCNRDVFHDHIPQIPNFRQNLRIQCASSHVEIEKNSKFGRHIVATEDIEIGEVLMVEEAVVATPSVDNKQHCHECLTMSFSPIPCETCTITFYCGEECKKKAQRYHKYECVVRRRLLLIAPEILSVDFLSLKLAIMMRHEFGRKQTPTNGYYYRSDRFLEILNLQEHSGKVDKFEKICWMTTGVFIYYILKKFTNFFKVPYEEEFKNFFKLLIIRTQAIVRSNVLPITEVNYKSRSKEHKDKAYSQEVFGYGLFSLNSLFNHSCSPNVGQYHYGTTVVARALGTIKKGSQCFVSYWSPYSKITFDSTSFYSRQEILRDYHYFTCRCIACSRKWGIFPIKLPCAVTPVIASIVDRVAKECDVRNITSYYLHGSISELRRLERYCNSTDFCLANKTIDFCFNAFGNKNLMAVIMRDDDADVLTHPPYFYANQL